MQVVLLTLFTFNLGVSLLKPLRERPCVNNAIAKFVRGESIGEGWFYARDP